MSVNIADHHAASDTSKSPHSHSISAVVSKSDSNILDINCDTFFFFYISTAEIGDVGIFTIKVLL